MLDDLNNLPEIDSYPDLPYRDMSYELLWYKVEGDGKRIGKVVDEDGYSKDIVPITGVESLSLLCNHKIVHWSKVEGIMRSTPRFYGIGRYDRRETNSLWIEDDISWRQWQWREDVATGDMVWFREGIYQWLGGIMGLLPVIECRGGWQRWRGEVGKGIG